MTGARITRRAAVLGAAALASGCTVAPRDGDALSRTPTASPQPLASGTWTPSPTTTASVPARDPQWVAAENALPGSDGWRLGLRADDRQLSGYADRVSVLPGEEVGLRISSSLGDVSVSAHRLGWYAGLRGREVWREPRPIKGRLQTAPRIGSLSAVVAPWQDSLRVDTTGWPEGVYVFVLRAGSRAAWIPLTLRTADPGDRLVLVNAVTTWQAYNQWGGHSLYLGPDKTFGSRSRAVSFDRPYDVTGAGRLMSDESSSIGLAEKLGLDLAYTTSVDLHRDAASVAGAAGVLSLGHDEYWTTPMRRNVERARDAGTNLGFLGANACYWRVRLEDSDVGDGRLSVGYKSASEDPVKGPDTTDLWRRGPQADPENTLTGMLYEAFPVYGDMVVHDPSHFLLEGTGAKRGEAIPGLVGIEIDRAYPVASTPKTLQVVMHSPVAAPGGHGTTHSDLTYYTAASGAGVVATGSMAFTKALDGPRKIYNTTPRSVAFAQRLTINLMTAMAAGPMGEQHPASPNLESIGASADTRTGTGFAAQWGADTRA